MPAGGDDLPPSEDGPGLSPPPALTVSSSDEEDEEIAADAGYQPLPVIEPDDDTAGDSETEVENAAESSSASAEALSSGIASNIALHSSHLPMVHQAYLVIYTLKTNFDELQLTVSIKVRHPFPHESLGESVLEQGGDFSLVGVSVSSSFLSTDTDVDWATGVASDL